MELRLFETGLFFFAPKPFHLAYPRKALWRDSEDRIGPAPSLLQGVNIISHLHPDYTKSARQFSLGVRSRHMRQAKDVGSLASCNRAEGEPRPPLTGPRLQSQGHKVVRASSGPVSRPKPCVQFHHEDARQEPNPDHSIG